MITEDFRALQLQLQSSSKYFDINWALLIQNYVQTEKKTNT